ncbi:MAG: TM2 domain-containing protein [Deltaproteobacteria bacterium]|nr:TM2 domain-containing protein [Deltaproteobacteria bacterium]
MSLTKQEKSNILEQEKLKRSIQGKSSVLAMILSFFLPGLGDLYCGSYVKGLIFIVLDVICFILIFFGIGLIVAPVLVICGVISAHLSAKKSGDRNIKKMEKNINK